MRYILFNITSVIVFIVE